MRRVVIGELRAHPRRIVAAGLAVMIGIAFVVVTIGVTQTMKGYLHRVVAVRATLSDVVVTTEELALPEAVVARVAALPEVDRAEPFRRGDVLVRWSDGDDRALVHSIPADERLRSVRVRDGRAPVHRNEVAVDARTADELGLEPGTSLDVVPVHLAGIREVGTEPGGDGRDSAGRSGAERLRVVGIVDTARMPHLSGGRRLLVGSDDAVRRWTGASLEEVDVLAAAGHTPEAVAAAVRRVTGAGAVVRTGPEEAKALATRATGDVDIVGRLLLGFAAVALAVATIVVTNVFTILLAQRTRTLALLRCVGATRRQLRAGVLGEAAAVGSVASGCGLALGAALTAAATGATAALVPEAAGTRPVLPMWALAWSFVLGLGVTVICATLPARRATRVAPLVALRPDPAERVRVVSRLRLLVGALLFAGGAAGVVGSIPDGRVLLGIVGGTVSLTGVLVTGPVLVPAVARTLGRPVRALGPVGRTAVGNAVRNPGRAAAASTALLVGVCLVTLMSVGAASATPAAGGEVVAPQPRDRVGSAPPDGQGVTEGVVRRIEALDGTAAVVALNAASVLVTPSGRDGPGESVEVLAVDPAGFARVLRTESPWPDGSLLVPRDAGELLGLPATGPEAGRERDGDVAVDLRLPGRAGATAEGPVVRRSVAAGDIPFVLMARSDLDLLVAGADQDPRAASGGQRGGAVDPAGSADGSRAASAADPGAGDRPVTQVWIRAEDGADARALRDAVLRSVREVRGASIDGPLDQRADMAQVMQILLWVVTALLGVALVIAVVGIGNTLSLSVLERTRESGLLRALGMTRRQLRGSLAVEAVLLAAVGVAVGTGLGIGYGWAAAACLGAHAVEHVPLVVPWGRITVLAVTAVAAGALASVLPARRATRVSPTAALGVE